MAIGAERKSPIETVRNLKRGISGITIPELGSPHVVGKVRENWIVEVGYSKYRILAATDRVSAFDRNTGTIPGKGRVLTLLSEFWFERTKDIIPNHMLSVPHPNIMVAKEAEETLPVEITVRAHESTGTIITPTTKAEKGRHGKELNDQKALEIVDGRLGDGIWNQAKNAALDVFKRASAICLEKDLVLADTKFEFGMDENGYLRLIGELLTPDSSRFWLAETYKDRLESGENPEAFDNEILERWLAERGFKGEGPIPQVDPQTIRKMAESYAFLYRMLTGKNLPEEDLRTTQYIQLPNTKAVSKYVSTAVYFNRD